MSARFDPKETKREAEYEGAKVTVRPMPMERIYNEDERRMYVLEYPSITIIKKLEKCMILDFYSDSYNGQNPIK